MLSPWTGCTSLTATKSPSSAPSHLKSAEVADVLQVAKTRILKALERLGAVQVMPDALAVDDAWAARDPVMAQLAAAAVAGLPPAGLAERKRAPVAILDGGRPAIVGELVVQDQGFNLHAKTRAGPTDQPAHARLLRYVLRPPLARERLERLPDHRVCLSLSSGGENHATPPQAQLSHQAPRTPTPSPPTPAPLSLHQMGRAHAPHLRP